MIFNFSTEPVEIDFLYKNLCNGYKETRCIPEGAEWPPYQPKLIVSVALIYYKGERTQQQLLEIAQLHKGGSKAVDKLITSNGFLPSPKKRRLDHSKISKNVTDIFEADFANIAGQSSSESPKSILIEGAPGIGKTVLIKEIAYRWASGEMLCRAELVFLIYLRNPSVQASNTLQQLLKLFVPDEMVPNICQHLFLYSGQNVVFLFDGFDEYPPKLREDSFILDIIKHKILFNSTVVVTSRPTATAALHNLVDRRIEILGFAEEDRKRYISESLSAGKEHELSNYLKQKPTINGLCYVPLNLVILLYLFQRGSLPETLTEMNESFIVHTIFRHLKRNPCEPEPSSTVKKLADLPKAILNDIAKFSTLAFKGLQNDQLVFTQDEIIKDHFPIAKAFNGFGLLQVVEHYPFNSAAGITTSFNFLHYTMQEFLAALHVSTLPIEVQRSLTKTFWDGKYKYMWMMYVGIVGINSEFFNTLISKGNKYKKGGVKLLKSITNDKRKLLHLFQCYSEAKSIEKLPNAITSMFKGGKIIFNGQTLLPHNISSLISFISFYKINLTILKLQDCHLGDSGMNILKQFMVNNKKLISKLDCINLMGNGSSPWDLYCAIIEHCSVGNLTIFGDDGMEEHNIQLQNCLEKNACLKSLTLFSIGRTALQSIKTILGSNKLQGLEEINLSWLNLDFKKAKVLLYTTQRLNNELTCDNNKKEIVVKVLWDGKDNCALNLLNMSSKLDNPDILLFIAFGLQNNKTICKLDLSNNSKCLSNEEGLSILCNFLERNDSALQELKLSNNCIGSKVKMVTKALQTNKWLQNLDISSNNICDDDVDTNSFFTDTRDYASDMSNCSMFHSTMIVNTSQCNLPKADINKLSIFKINKLSIANNNISSAVLSGCIASNSFLQELDISESAITDQGTRKIAEAITTSILTKLNVSKNYITIEGLLYLFAPKSSLKVLDVTYNNVTKLEFNEIECILKSSSLVKVNASWNEIVLGNKLEFKSAIFEFSNLKKAYIQDDIWPINNIKDYNAKMEFLSNSLKEDIALLNLNLRNHGIDGNGGQLIAKAIQLNITLQNLDISCNTLSDKGATAICECLKINRSLQVLGISENNITSIGATNVAKLMLVNTTLRKLDISRNWITSEALLLLLKAIKDKGVLQFLNITHNNVTKSEFIKLQECIKHMSAQVKLSWNEIELDSELQFTSICEATNSNDDEIDKWPFRKISNQDARMEFLSNCLKENDTLFDLDLRNNGITDIGATLIAQAIEINKTLKILSMSHNKLSDDGVTAICTYLKNNNTLQQLDLSENEISGRGANEIGHLIKKNASLLVLDISCMCICNDGITIIAQCLKNNRSLQELNISLNKITSIGAKKIAEILRENTTLQKLNIAGNKISDDGAAAVSKSLENNCCLQELYMSETDVSSEGTMYIAAAIKVNKHLHTLHLHHHNVDNSYSFNNAILDAVFQNSTLKQLNCLG